MLEIEINGKLMEVAEGSTIMDATNQAGVYVPHFCYHRKLSIAANCRMCLVQVEKAPKPCRLRDTGKRDEGPTHSAGREAHKGSWSFAINHPLDCPICDQGGHPLQDLAVATARAARVGEPKRVVTNKNWARDSTD